MGDWVIWGNRFRIYHINVVRDVPIEPARVRRKLNKLDAEAIFSGGKPESVMVVSGIKKQATAKPCTNCGKATSAKVISGSKVTARQ